MNQPTDLEKKFAQAIVDAQYSGTDPDYGIDAEYCPWCYSFRPRAHKPTCIVLDAKKVLEAREGE